ncbi:MAG: host attachment protein [Gammaproteobacteria bacterium]|nr:host attachment protein [Gammaproteobacteria bacterium]
MRGTGKGIPGHRYDDHRSRHREELERRFAKNVAARAARLAREEQAGQVVLVAQKRMLGLLRRELDTLAKAGLGIREIAKDLGRLDPPSIQAHLARERLLPARRGLGGPA